MAIKTILVSQPKPEGKKSPYFDLAKKYNLQINKIASYPIYLSMMTVFAGIIMFNVRSFNSNTLKISFGLFSSVLIYYMNNFFNVMGKTETIPIIFSVWAPIIFLIIINFIYTIKINEK